MSVKKITTTTVTQVGNQRPQTRTSASTSVTYESPRQRARRVASENSTFFRFVLSGSLGLFFMVMILLVGTTAFYVDNQDDLTWLNSDGTFNQDSYNYQIISNDTPIPNLNDLTLNEFFNYNVILNGDFSDGTNYWQFGNASVVNGMAYIGNIAADGYIRPLSYIFPFTNDGNIYFIVWSQSIVTGGGNRLFNNILYAYNGIQTYKGLILGTPIFDNLGTSQYYIDDVYAINLTALGLTNLTEKQLYDYYELWLKNKNSRSLNLFYGLGDVVVSNYQGFGQNIAQPASQVLDALRPRIENVDEGVDMIRDGWRYIFTGELFVDLWKEIWGDE